MRVHTGSRLHFGLLSLEPVGSSWPNREGNLLVPARSYGGVGLMVDDPAVMVEVEPASTWSAEGPLAKRVLQIAERLTQQIQMRFPNRDFPPARIQATGPDEHIGLGVGTQLAMAVATGLTTLWQLPCDWASLAQSVGRGRRSSLGIHGFVEGGFLVEAGKRRENEVSPLAARLDFPSTWPLLLLMVPDRQGRHGHSEEMAFARLVAEAPTADLCRMVLLGLIPAVQTADYQAFTEAIYDFNQRAGEAFASQQGGVYSSPEVLERVSWLRTMGVKAVGQSSWGPTVFAVLPDADALTFLQLQLQGESVPRHRAIATRARNQGASVSSP
jgi:beta-ribofuranosylaminobenzene 5'-phosphate synthase